MASPGLTFQLHLLHRALGQRVEGVPWEVGRWVGGVGFPLLQDVLQQLIKDVACTTKRSEVSARLLLALH